MCDIETSFSKFHFGWIDEFKLEAHFLGKSIKSVDYNFGFFIETLILRAVKNRATSIGIGDKTMVSTIYRRGKYSNHELHFT